MKNPNLNTKPNQRLNLQLSEINSLKKNLTSTRQKLEKAIMDKEIAVQEMVIKEGTINDLQGNIQHLRDEIESQKIQKEDAIQKAVFKLTNENSQLKSQTFEINCKLKKIDGR